MTVTLNRDKAWAIDLSSQDAKEVLSVLPSSISERIPGLLDGESTFAIQRALNSQPELSTDGIKTDIHDYYTTSFLLERHCQ